MDDRHPVRGTSEGSTTRDRVTTRDRLLLFGLPAMAAPFVLAGSTMGWWALVAGIAVYVAGYAALDQWRRTEATHDGVAAALGALPGVAGEASTERVRVVGETAHGIGVRLGLDERSLALVVRAARCRDVGRISRERRTDRGDPDGMEGQRWGRRIVAESGGLAGTAALIAPPAPGGSPRGHRPLGAIVDVAVGYGEAVTGMGLDPADAVALLRHTAAADAGSALVALDEMVSASR